MADIEAHESKLYSELAPVYDKVFGKIFTIGWNASSRTSIYRRGRRFSK